MNANVCRSAWRTIDEDENKDNNGSDTDSLVREKKMMEKRKINSLTLYYIEEYILQILWLCFSFSVLRLVDFQSVIGCSKNTVRVQNTEIKCAQMSHVCVRSVTSTSMQSDMSIDHSRFVLHQNMLFEKGPRPSVGDGNPDGIQSWLNVSKENVEKCILVLVTAAEEKEKINIQCLDRHVILASNKYS